MEQVDGKDELVVTPLDKLDEPDSLVKLRAAVNARLPRVDLPEVLLEIAARTDFTSKFTHVSERESRMQDLPTSLCANLIAEACNIGLEPLTRNDVPALRRSRLSWVSQNFIRNETLVEANACLVAEHNKIPLVHQWGGGEVASADGLRFVVPVRTLHAGPEPEILRLRARRDLLQSRLDQFTGLNAIVIPGTLRDSLYLLAVVLEQQTELQSHRDHDRHRSIYRCCVRTVLAAGLPFLPADRRYRGRPLLADRSVSRLWFAEWHRPPSHQHQAH